MDLHPVDTKPIRLSLVLPFAVLALAWLLPNHYFPWASFWQEGAAALAFIAVLVSGPVRNSPVRVPWLAAASMSMALVPLLQWQSGLIHFAGDASLASLYLLGFGLAVTIPALQGGRLDWLLGGLAWAALVAAVVSVGLGLCQWLDLDGLGVFLMDLPYGGRPYANLAQPNQLATLFMLGLVAACGLFQNRRLTGVVLGVVAATLIFGIAMTQSRTAWLEMAAVCLWAWAVRDRVGLRVERWAILAAVVYLALLVLIWPIMNQALYLVAGRTLDTSVQFGQDLRWRLWSTMIDAISKEPWWGYGWNQVSVAQMRSAADHPFTGEMVEHSHNFVLDLLIWNGIPLGVLVLGGLVAWFCIHVRACSSAMVAWLLAAIAVIIIHGLLEFPLEYAYFLLPLGAMMGAVEMLSMRRGGSLAVSRGLIHLFVVLAVALLAWVMVEYTKVEEHYRQMRFELAGFGKAPDREKLDDIVLLTQLRDFQRFARVPARRQMSQDELQHMRHVAERYGYPPVLLRYALALALNGHQVESARTLTVLCRIHPPERCREGAEAWNSMASTVYPELWGVQWPLFSDSPVTNARDPL